jgi:hypothetical protein
MKGTTTATKQVTRRVVIGGREYEKPWDPACGACRSPWLSSIDSMLAEGYSLRRLRQTLAGMHPAVPNEAILRLHIEHLAEPHARQRAAFEEEAARRGEDTAATSAGLGDALKAIIAQGTQQLASGELEVGARDMLRALQLQLALEKAQAGEGVEASAWQAAFMSFFEIVRRHLTGPQWKAFVTDVYASPEIRAVMSDAAPAAIPGEGP